MPRLLLVNLLAVVCLFVCFFVLSIINHDISEQYSLTVIVDQTLIGDDNEEHRYVVDCSSRDDQQ